MSKFIDPLLTGLRGQRLIGITVYVQIYFTAQENAVGLSEFSDGNSREPEKGDDHPLWCPHAGKN